MCNSAQQSHSKVTWQHQHETGICMPGKVSQDTTESVTKKNRHNGKYVHVQVRCTPNTVCPGIELCFIVDTFAFMEYMLHCSSVEIRNN